MIFESKDYARPLHEMKEEQVLAWAKEAEAQLNKEKGEKEPPYELSVRSTRLKIHIYVDIKQGNRESTITPTMMGEEITSAEELKAALLRELASRERSQDYIDGKIGGEVFEGYQPEGLEENEYPAFLGGVEEKEEDRAC